MEIPLPRSSSRRAHNWCRDWGPGRWWVRPGLKRSGSLMRERARTRRRIIPPESSLTGAFERWPRAMKSRSSTAFFRASFFGDIEIPGKHLQVLEDGQIRIHAVFLLADTDAGFDLAPVPGDIQPEHFQAAPAHGRETINHPDRSCLPAPFGPRIPKHSPVAA